jgi:hypothetical protein
MNTSHPALSLGHGSAVLIRRRRAGLVLQTVVAGARNIGLGRWGERGGIAGGGARGSFAGQV